MPIRDRSERRGSRIYRQSSRLLSRNALSFLLKISVESLGSPNNHSVSFPPPPRQSVEVTLGHAVGVPNPRHIPPGIEKHVLPGQGKIEVCLENARVNHLKHWSVYLLVCILRANFYNGEPRMWPLGADLVPLLRGALSPIWNSTSFLSSIGGAVGHRTDASSRTPPPLPHRGTGAVQSRARPPRIDSNTRLYSLGYWCNGLLTHPMPKHL